MVVAGIAKGIVDGVGLVVAVAGVVAVAVAVVEWAVMLRPHQREAVKSAYVALSGRQNPCVVHATGTGKSVTLAVLADLWLRRLGKRVLVTTIREELIRQLRSSFLRFLPRLRPHQIGIEQADKVAAHDVPIVIASVDSLTPERVARMGGNFDLVIVDEAHRSPAALSSIFAALPKALRAGFTATPDRLDELPLSTFFDTLASVYELDQAIEDGVLCKLEFATPYVYGETGVPEADEITLLDVAAQAVRERCANLPAIIFVSSVYHAQELARRLGPGARPVWGDMPPSERRRAIDEYADQKYPWIVSRDLLTFGFDAPWVRAIVIARATRAGSPTASRALHSQMVGRGTRQYPGKHSCLVVDVVGATHKHALVTPEEVLHWPQSVLDASGLHPRASSDDNREIEALLDKVDEEMDLPSVSEISRAEAVRLGWADVDPLLAILGTRLSPREKESRSATPAQIKALEGAGVEGAGFLTQEQAGELFEVLRERRRLGRCTLKQARTIIRWGLNPNASFASARWVLDRLSAERWKRLPSRKDIPKDLIYRGAVPLEMK